jgi:hypothetical protein
MRGSDRGVEAAIGYAASPRGNGVVYARLTAAGIHQVLRLTFRVAASGQQTDRASAYAALTVAARALLKRGFRQTHFLLDDAQLVDEISNRRQLPDALVLSYVRLRCVLNSLSSFSLNTAATDDLTQRARAEVALNLAA